MYQLGVSRKKQDLIILVSTAADSIAAKNRPKVNKNKNMLPKGLGNPWVKISFILKNNLKVGYVTKLFLVPS